MSSAVMNLRVLLPAQSFVERHDVRRMTVQTCAGSYGILPHRLDCVATLVPGILFYDSEEDGETYLGVDEGALVKTGLTVTVCVRRAFPSPSLAELRDIVRHELFEIDERERRVREVMTKLETGLLRRLGEVDRGHT